MNLLRGLQIRALLSRQYTIYNFVLLRRLNSGPYAGIRSGAD